jgi:hypothetical protein
MTRRHFLAGLSMPLLLLDAVSSDVPGITILPENHLLSQESVAAYSALLAQVSAPRRTVILLPGAKRLSLGRSVALRRSLEAGSSVLIEGGLAFSTSSEIEEQRRVLHHGFGIQLGRPIAASTDSHRPYVTFRSGHLVRPFGFTFPVFCEGGQPLARFGEAPVAFKARMGSGTLIFLGAMLGPHLQAFDSDGFDVAKNLLVELSC